jgi:ribA/ribD-fused uncharacterized protein
VDTNTLDSSSLGLEIDGVTVRGNLVLFWHGPFSNWHLTSFVVDGQAYNCTEQHMMAEKARLFDDQVRRAQILANHSPKKQKALGRQVTPFSDTRWRKHCEEIVYQGNLAKFRSDPELRATLLRTGTRIIAEASPVDRVWGIGLHADSEDASMPERWRGENLLGKVLMRTRATLANETAPAR